MPGGGSPGRSGGAMFGLGCCRGGPFEAGGGGYGFPSTIIVPSCEITKRQQQ